MVLRAGVEGLEGSLEFAFVQLTAHYCFSFVKGLCSPCLTHFIMLYGPQPKIPNISSSGTPSPIISFEYKNGTQILNKGRFYVTPTSLEIWAARVSDSADYKCLGYNGDETVTAEFQVKVSTYNCNFIRFIEIFFAR